MESLKQALSKHWKLGLGLSAPALIFLYTTFMTKDDARAAHEQIRAEIQVPLSMMAAELCRLRFRLDVQAGIPNPGGCGK